MRNESIDILKGIGIAFVVLGHTDLSSIGGSTWQYIYSFHMPLFFFTSGYFLVNNNGLSFARFLAKKIKAIIIPYTFLFLISLFFGYFLITFISGNPYPDLNLKKVIAAYLLSGGRLTEIPIYNFPLWFLPCLFLAELICFFLFKLKSNIFIFSIIVVISILTASFQYLFEGRPPFHFNVIPAAIVFMGFGFFYKRYLNDLHFPKYFSIFILLLSLILFSQNKNTHIASIGNPVIYFSSAILSIIFYFNVSKTLNSGCLLSWIGRNSLYIFGIHSLVITAIYETPIFQIFNNLDGITLVMAKFLTILSISSLIVYFYCYIKGKLSSKKISNISHAKLNL